MLLHMPFLDLHIMNDLPWYKVKIHLEQIQAFVGRTQKLQKEITKAQTCRKAERLRGKESGHTTTREITTWKPPQRSHIGI